LKRGVPNRKGFVEYIATEMSHSTADEFVMEMLCTQYGMNQELNLFQDEGEETVVKELQQMHDLKVVEGMEPSTISPEMRKKALSYLMFLNRKKSGTVKGRGCADGRKQKEYVKKEDAASPTVSIQPL